APAPGARQPAEEEDAVDLADGPVGPANRDSAQVGREVRGFGRGQAAREEYPVGRAGLEIRGSGLDGRCRSLVTAHRLGPSLWQMPFGVPSRRWVLSSPPSVRPFSARGDRNP